MIPNMRGILGLLLLFAVQASATSNTTTGSCVNPRVRREWRTIPEAERIEWINAVKCLTKVPHKEQFTPLLPRNVSQIGPIVTNSSYFDDFSYIHMDLNEVIHFTGQFFPFHRAYVWNFELALQEECGYTGSHPYWDWTQDADNFYNSSIWDPSTAVSGLGGWGDPNDDYQITDGVFSEDFTLVYPSVHRLRRNFTLLTGAIPYPDGTGADQVPGPRTMYITPEVIESQVNGPPGDFVTFQAAFEDGAFGPHGSIHGLVGGDMVGTCPANAPSDCVRGPKWPPNDPLFMLHHAMVDKVWYDWQHRHPENFWAFEGGAAGAHLLPGVYAQFPTGGPPFLNFGTPIPTDNILKNATIYELMDTTGGYLCYVYE